MAKTDPIDARTLAHFAEAVQPPARAVLSQALEELGALVTRHRQLIEMIVAERNRRMSMRGAVRKDVDATIHFLRERLTKIDEQLKTSAPWPRLSNIPRLRTRALATITTDRHHRVGSIL